MNIKQFSALIALLKTNKIISLQYWDIGYEEYQIDIILNNFTTFSLPIISLNNDYKTQMLINFDKQVRANKLLAQDYLIETLMGCERLYFACNAASQDEPWFNEAELCFVMEKS